MFYRNPMDWDMAIERHRVPLLGIVAWLFAEIGLTEGRTVERLSKPLYRKVLGVLRAAEFRRSIVPRLDCRNAWRDGLPGQARQ